MALRVEVGNYNLVLRALICISNQSKKVKKTASKKKENRPDRTFKGFEERALKVWFFI
jgi:hypothetical protein